MTGQFSAEEIVIRLIERGVPREKAEAAAARFARESERLHRYSPPKRKRAKGVKRPKGLDLEQRKFRLLCHDHGLPLPTCEYKFSGTRNWRADFAFVPERVLVEVEGGIYSHGRHVRGKGYEKDMEKYTAASLLGFTLIRVTPKNLNTLATIQLVRAALTPSETE